MAIQTSFAKELTGSQDCDYRFLALLGNDSELDLALLDVKNGVRDLSLGKDNLILPISRYRLAPTHLGEKYLGIKRGFNSLLQNAPLFLSREGSPQTKARARREEYSDSTAQMKSGLVRTVGERLEIGEFATPRLRFYRPSTPMDVQRTVSD